MLNSVCLRHGRRTAVVPGWLVLALTLTLGSGTGGAFAAADGGTSESAQPCPEAVAQVVSGLAADRQDACRGAAAAWAFFRSLGLEPTATPTLEITPKLPPEAGETAVGCYLPQRKRVLMLPYREFLKQRTWFTLPIGRELYRSLAAHETAHALAGCLFAIERPSIQAHEYVAYVAMLSSMEPGLRARVLRAYPGEGFDSEDRITPMFYMFDPMRFGAQAYRHYLKPEAGPAFLKAVLAGTALRD